jgi:hypothetical protein
VSTTSQNAGGQTLLALFDNALVGLTNYMGQTVATNSVIGKYTYFGDANLDGKVTGDDYSFIDANLNTSPDPRIARMNGDLNLDGTVTGDDYSFIDANLGQGNVNPLAPQAVAVPEPAGVGAVLFGLLALRRRRREKRVQTI